MNEGKATESIRLRREAVDVGVLLELTTEVMQREARMLGITLNLRIDDEVPATVRLDRDKVAWAITSVVGSALRHVRRHGGRVDVHVAWDASRLCLSIDVRDNGPGIPAGQLATLLRREGWHPGSALGLLLVEDIAAAHGGSLSVESKIDALDHFTNVRFTIPAG